jgi:hypothetical protein
MMRKINNLFVFLILTGIVFTSCNKVKELADVTFNTSYDANLNVVVPATRNVSFETEATIDPTADEEVQTYLDNIKSFEVQSMTATITSISKDVTLVTSDLTVFNSSKTATWHMENLPLSLGASIPLDNANGQWDTVNQIFDDKTAFTVKLVGETDEGDVTFTLKVSITTKITANPL